MKKSELKQAVTAYKYNVQVAENKAVIYEKVYNYLITKRDEAKLATTKALYQDIKLLLIYLSKDSFTRVLFL